MRLSLKTKFTLATSLLVLAVVAVVSGLYLGRLTSQVLRQADDRARFVAQQVFLACQNALAEAAETGTLPRSANPGDMREYVRQTLDNSSPLNSLIESAVGYSPTHLRNYDQRQRRHGSGVERRVEEGPEECRCGPALSRWCAQILSRQLRDAVWPASNLRILSSFQPGLRPFRRHSHRPFLHADAR